MSHAMEPSSGQSSGEKSTLSVRSMSGEPQTPDQIEAEIEVQRQALAETIDALSAKLDVKSQAQAKVEEVKHTAQSKLAHVKETAQAKVGSAQTKVGSASGTVGHTVRTGATSSGSPRPELLAFALTVVVATAVLWWRER
jgi:cobalamin biosynthesis Mg chelatase CobN